LTEKPARVGIGEHIADRLSRESRWPRHANPEKAHLPTITLDRIRQRDVDMCGLCRGDKSRQPRVSAAVHTPTAHLRELARVADNAGFLDDRGDQGGAADND